MDQPRPATRRLDVALTLLVLAVGATWALLTPPLRAPDEPQHLNSVVRLAYGGGWPEPGDAVLAPALLQARDDVALATDVPGRWHDRDEVPAFADAVVVPGAERARVDATTALPPALATTPDGADDVDPAGTDPADIDQMTQHPPLYYALGAAVLRATGLADARWDHQLLALRLLDVVLLAPLVPLAAWSARRLTGSTAAGAVAGLMPLLSPQVGHILGSVTNDALVTLVGGAVTALCVRVLTGDRGWRTAVVVGAVVGVGLLTKAMPAFLLPVVAGAYLLSPGGALGAGTVRRWAALRDDAGRVATLGAVALAVGGWWWVRNLVVHGTVQPVGLVRVPEQFEPGSVAHFLRIAGSTLALTFFGDFGWLDLRMPVAFWLSATAAALVLAAVALTAPGTRRAVAVLLALPAVLAVAVVANAWDYYAEHGWLVGVQGRYLFVSLVAMGVVLAVAVRRLAGGVEARVAWAVPVLLGVALAATAYGWWVAFTGFYRAPGWSLAQAWDRWVLLAPVGPAWLAGVPVLAALIALATGALAVHAAARRPRTGP
ncbi:hypothetical protein Xcel_2556 [Xylanimonas cellulosilytica DSM 15894]|uniref:Glycosyltransferase RgtA/B/C/D-like domain-containing protein n=1 Tax=Xylanimonas cellulosilytica (strain DSM 15894 / JCM 12276 / CECT 5975 / KCTC 9989 / LMG 20990 / NBRC 107835 / XIL07) TaxID=446471 RepID=D1BX03_XYLCX|nr:DUF2142 domain-containing protein [Xylanimonas cellulosilytica]ACZ31571.1 hypothetical protein Xcel_2556 [Xylanimonas cellulosilytica DSM 15894]